MDFSRDSLRPVLHHLFWVIVLAIIADLLYTWLQSRNIIS